MFARVKAELTPPVSSDHVVYPKPQGWHADAAGLFLSIF
jgi:hypothetical protein